MIEVSTTDLLAKIGSLVMENDAMRNALIEQEKRLDELERPATDDPPPSKETTDA